MHINGGSFNIIEFCSFSGNGDSGLQLDNGASGNQIINCDSYQNADPPDYGDADGFAPKLSVGGGNSFRRMQGVGKLRRRLGRIPEGIERRHHDPRGLLDLEERLSEGRLGSRSAGQWKRLQDGGRRRRQQPAADAPFHSQEIACPSGTRERDSTRTTMRAP